MEEQLFLSLIKANQGIIYKVCRLYGHTSDDQADLFQEIVFQLWRSIDSFRNEAKASTFIYRIAINTAISSFRKNKITRVIDYTGDLPDTPGTVPDENILERSHMLTNALKMLPEGERAIIALLLDELSYREISEIIGISENNVAVKISRIKNKLKNILNT